MIERINPDNIPTLLREQLMNEKSAIPENLSNLNELCANFLRKYKSISFFNRQDEATNDLTALQSAYDKLLTVLTSIDDDERLRTIIKDYPVLNAEKFRIPKFGKAVTILMLLFFPVALIAGIWLVNRRKQLKYILLEITTINNNLLRILSHEQSRSSSSQT